MSNGLTGAVGVRGIAIVEAIKELLVLAVQPVRHTHLNPASRYPHSFDIPKGRSSFPG